MKIQMYVRDIGQGEAMHRKYKRLKLEEYLLLGYDAV
jgi:hypothetical protein